MRAGKLRHCMTLQTATTTRDADSGQRTKAWTDRDEIQAWVKPLSGDELQIARATDALVTHEIRIRYFEGLTPEMRLKFGTRIFNIRSVLDVDNRGVEMLLTCKEDV